MAKRDMSGLKIEKNVPIPKSIRPHNGLSAIFMKMEPGDSVFIPGPQSPRSTAIYAIGRGQYRCIREGDGHRVWKLK